MSLGMNRLPRAPGREVPPARSHPSSKSTLLSLAKLSIYFLGGLAIFLHGILLTLTSCASFLGLGRNKFMNEYSCKAVYGSRWTGRTGAGMMWRMGGNFVFGVDGAAASCFLNIFARPASSFATSRFLCNADVAFVKWLSLL